MIAIDKKNTPIQISWLTAAVFLIFHILGIAALFFFTWPAAITALVLYWLSLTLGIGMGYHRLLTHRGYKIPKWLEYSFAVCGTLALEGGPIFWVGTHRIHHQKSDQPGDPHSPRDGGWWAHVLWMILGQANHANTALMSRYAPDLAKDRFYVWLNNYHWVPLTVLGLVLLAVGGVPVVLWAIFLRVSIGLHVTWAVNSATHMWGYKRFATRDDSRNNWLVALLSFGEGWHNNHHAHPTSARHGLAWYELDISWLQIKLLEKLGLARNVKVAKTSSALPIAEREAA
jgi:stearoyl-CoA desaturase (delta-9 desaturase)